MCFNYLLKTVDFIIFIFPSKNFFSKFCLSKTVKYFAKIVNGDFAKQHVFCVDLHYMLMYLRAKRAYVSLHLMRICTYVSFCILCAFHVPTCLCLSSVLVHKRKSFLHSHISLNCVFSMLGEILISKGYVYLPKLSLHTTATGFFKLIYKIKLPFGLIVGIYPWNALNVNIRKKTPWYLWIYLVNMAGISRKF